MSGLVQISVDASDNVGVTGLQFKIGAVNLGSAIANEPYSANWDTSGVPNGSYVISAVASDAALNSGSASLTVNVNNPQNANIVNNINTSSNSGNNTTNYNTRVEGGVRSGNASSSVIVTNLANNSVITVGP